MFVAASFIATETSQKILALILAGIWLVGFLFVTARGE